MSKLLSPSHLSPSPLPEQSRIPLSGVPSAASSPAHPSSEAESEPQRGRHACPLSLPSLAPPRSSGAGGIRRRPPLRSPRGSWEARLSPQAPPPTSLWHMVCIRHPICCYSTQPVDPLALSHRDKGEKGEPETIWDDGVKQSRVQGLPQAGHSCGS